MSLVFNAKFGFSSVLQRAPDAPKSGLVNSKSRGTILRVMPNGSEVEERQAEKSWNYKNTRLGSNWSSWRRMSTSSALGGILPAARLLVTPDHSSFAHPERLIGNQAARISAGRWGLSRFS